MCSWGRYEPVETGEVKAMFFSGLRRCEVLGLRLEAVRTGEHPLLSLMAMGVTSACRHRNK